MKNQFLTLLFSVFSILCTFGQEKITISELEQANISDTTVFRIELTDQTIIIGKIIKNRTDFIEVLTKNLGPVILRKDKVKYISIVQGPNEDEKSSLGKKRNDMVGSNQYFISNSAFNLKKGEANIRFTDLFFIGGGYGITDFLSVSAGMTFIPTVPFSEQVYFFMPKISFEILPWMTVSGHVLPLITLDENISLYGLTSTFGSRSRNLSLGYTGAFGEPGAGILNISGVYRFDNWLALVTNNLLAVGNDIEVDLSSTLFGFGARAVGTRNSFDFGLLFFPEDQEGLPFPYINYTFRF